MGQDRRLLVEPLGLAHLAAGEDLDRDRRAGGEIAGAKDRAHAAGASFGDELESPGDDSVDHIVDFGRKTVTLSV